MNEEVGHGVDDEGWEPDEECAREIGRYAGDDAPPAEGVIPRDAGATEIGEGRYRYCRNRTGVVVRAGAVVGETAERGDVWQMDDDGESPCLKADLAVDAGFTGAEEVAGERDGPTEGSARRGIDRGHDQEGNKQRE